MLETKNSIYQSHALCDIKRLEYKYIYLKYKRQFLLK